MNWKPARLLALVAGATTLLALPAPVSAAAPGGVAVLTGTSPTTTVFPNNRFVVRDGANLSGLRVNLPVPACNDANYSICDDIRLLNLQDGFDTRPRVTIPFSGPIDVASVTPASVYISGPGGFRTGLTQLVWDPAANVLAGQSDAYLNEATTYTINVTGALRSASGAPVDACGRGCQVRFTTQTATPELLKLRAALDNGSAYQQAGIAPAQRGANFVQDGVRDVFPAQSVLEIDRADQVYADPNRPLAVSQVLNSAVAGAGYYGFGSYVVPRYQDAEAVIPHVPTTQTPRALTSQRVGFTLIVPAGTTPAGGWPVAIFGPGFTRSKYDLFLAADLNAARGVATIATDPAGHSFGPQSRVIVKQATGNTSFLGYGQGRDLDGDGDILASEGVSPTDHKTVDSTGRVTSDLPSHFATVGLRDGLIQTVVNDMALVRLLERGVDVLGDGKVTLARTGVTYYGQSFGGIYGTMLLATDTHLRIGVPNVPGGPITEIARLSAFRHLLADQLRVARPTLLNGGPGLDGFTESMPLRLDAPELNPYPGATTIQKYLADSNWQERAGSPESFTPLLRKHPVAGAPTKHVIFQTAFGDDTVPNSTAGEMYIAGDVFDLVTYYRNDRTPSAKSDPHGFLLDPRLSGRNQAQLQIIEFLTSGGTTILNPNPAWFEVPVVNRRNLECTHYPQPQTGTPWAGSAGEC